MSARKFALDCWYLFYVQILEQRSMLAFLLFFGTFFPVLMVFGFGHFGGGLTYEGLLYTVSGAAVLSLVVSGINMVGQGVAEMKQNGTFIYYASLPISKAALIVGLLGSRVLISIPGLVLSLVAGTLLYGTPLPVNPLIVVIMILAAVSMSGVGAAIGIVSPNQYIASFITQVAQVVVIFAAPILMPVSSLPLPLQITGYLLPPTYAADALRRALIGATDGTFLLDIGILALCGVASLVLTARGLKWRLSA